MPGAKLESFLIYNPTYGPREGQEHLKVLYYHPESEKLDTKINNVGLCEALVQFAKAYSPSKPCESLHTQKRRQVFFEAEDDFWFIMTVSNPWKETLRDGKPYKEYHEEAVKDVVLQAVLRQSYAMFKIFMGTLASIFEHEGVEVLKKKLEDFYGKYLPDVVIENCDILDVLNGVQYFPSDRSTYLQIQSFINSMLSTFSELKYTVVLYEDRLIISDIGKEDTQTLYSYLVNKLLPTSSDFENGVVGSYLTRDGSYGRFLAGVRYYEHSTDGHSTTVFLNTGERLQMVTYQVLNMNVTLLFSGDAAPSIDIFRKMDSFMGGSMIQYSTTLENISSKSISSSEAQYKFIYFNCESLSVRSSCHHRDNNGFIKCTITGDVMKVILTIRQEFVNKNSDVELITKSSSDYWIIAKKFAQHECYIVVSLKNANLIEVNEEVRKICAQHIPPLTLAD